MQPATQFVEVPLQRGYVDVELARQAKQGEVSLLCVSLSGRLDRLLGMTRHTGQNVDE
jgi:hypothetical protein